ncbi:MAG: hypothetical protein P1V20_09465 [Verrucomicrobiales bacterium]|nr:hypothetical protein [Verrucomicrobiales bacterium]
MKRWIIIAVFVVLGILHQDFWNWSDSSLVFGFLPKGLAYHAGYSIVAALFWAAVVIYAWPTQLEEWAEKGESEDNK